MATDGTKDTTGTRTLPDVKEVLEALPDGRVLGDAAHRVLHRRNLRIEQAREASLSRDAMRLAAKHGADAPRARTERARADAQAREVRVYRDEVRKARVSTPPVDEGQAALYGRVIDGDGRGLGRHEVRLEGPKGMAEAVKTDRCGRFRIVLGDDIRKKDPQWEERDVDTVEVDETDAARAEREKEAQARAEKERAEKEAQDSAEKERAEKERAEKAAAEANADDAGTDDQQDVLREVFADRSARDRQAQPSMKKGPSSENAGAWARSQAAEYLSERLDDVNRRRAGGGQTAAVRVTVLDPEGEKVAGSRETLVEGQALYREYTVRSKRNEDC
ncbi:MAG: hypothetical protein RJQ04_09660 [Longimicrobiales bacterium]